MSLQEDVHTYSLWGVGVREKLVEIPERFLKKTTVRKLGHRAPRRSDWVFQLVGNQNDEFVVWWNDEKKVFVLDDWAIMARTQKGFLAMAFNRYSPSVMSKFLKKEHDNGHYLCPQCEESKHFSNYVSLSKHMAAKHEMFSCDYVCLCGFYSQYKRTLDQHVCNKKHFVKAFKLRSEKFQFSEEQDKLWRRIVKKRLVGDYEFLENMDLNEAGEKLREKLRSGEPLNSDDKKRIKALRMAHYRENVETQGAKDEITKYIDEFKQMMVRKGITGVALEVGEQLSLAIMAWEACRTWTGMLATITHFCCKVLKLREEIAKKLAAVAWHLQSLIQIDFKMTGVTTQVETVTSLSEFSFDVFQTIIDAVLKYCGLAISLPGRFLYGLHQGVVTARDAIAVKEIVTTHIPDLIESLHCWIKGVPTRAQHCRELVKGIYEAEKELSAVKVGDRDLSWASRVEDAMLLCDTYEEYLPEINARSTWYLQLATREVGFKIKKLREYRTAAHSLTNGAEARVEPVGVLFQGPGGILKSAFMKKLAHQFIAHRHGKYGKIDPKELDFYIWSRPKGSERMDGVKPFHQVFFYDDVAVERNEDKRGAELCELIPLCTSLPYCANVADLEGKGNIFLRPELVLLSMNARIDDTAKLGLSDNAAFLRRFIVVEVSPKGGLERAKKVAKSRLATKFEHFDEVATYKVTTMMGNVDGHRYTAGQLYDIILTENKKRLDFFEREKVFEYEVLTRNTLNGPVLQGDIISDYYASVDRNYDKERAMFDARYGGMSIYYDKALRALIDKGARFSAGAFVFCGLRVPFLADSIVALGVPPFSRFENYYMGESPHDNVLFAQKGLKGDLIHHFGWSRERDVLVFGAHVASPGEKQWRKNSPVLSSRVEEISLSESEIENTELKDPPGRVRRQEVSLGRCARWCKMRRRIPCCYIGQGDAIISSSAWKSLFSIVFTIVSLFFGNFWMALLFFVLNPLVSGFTLLGESLLGFLVAYVFAIKSRAMRNYTQYALAIFGTIVASYGTYWLAKRVLSTNTQSIRKKEMVEAPHKHKGVESAKFQGPDMIHDQMMMQQMDAVFEKNQFFALTPEGRKIQLLGFARDLFLTTNHEWITIAQSEKVFIIRNSFREEVDMKNITKSAIIPSGSHVPEAVILKIQGMQVKDIVSKFRLSTDYASQYYQCYVSRMSRKDNLIYKTHIPISTVTFDRNTSLIMNDKHLGEVLTRGFLVGSGATVDGDCTAPWFVADPRIPRKIAGIHIAGNKDRGYAYCSVIFQEWLIDAKRHFGYTQPDDLFVTEHPVTQCFPNTVPMGIVVPKFAGSELPPKTKLKKSGLEFNGAFFPCLSLVWKKSGDDHVFQRDVYISEITRYRQKFARIPKCPANFADFCMLLSPSLSDVAAKLRHPMATLSEVLNGDPVYGTSEINLKGAKGFPEDRLYPGRGKSPIIFKDHSDEIIKCSSSYLPVLEQSLEHIFEEDGGCLNYARVSWKDELGVKLRLFFAGNVPHYVAGDMVLGRFFSQCRSLRWFGPGTSLNTKESHFVVMYLRSNDFDEHRVIMLDISGMDLSESYEALCAVHKLIIYSISLVHDDPDWEKKCAAWCRASLHQVWIFVKTVFFLRGRMASGQRFTAELNTILLHCELLYCFICGWMENNEGTKEDAFEAWEKDIRDIEYGDDSLLTIRKGCHMWFTPKYIVDFMAANFGMVFTSAIKDAEVGFCTFEEAQFLRRNFIVVEGFWHAVLPVENIVGTLEWYNVSSGTKADAVVAKVRSALDELGLYPEDVYNHWKRKIAQQCAKHGYPITDIPYDVMRQRYLTG